MAVSLICTIAIMSAFAVFEGQKRTTSSGNDAQQNGSFSLYALERQIRSAGSGLVQGKSYGLWGCPINARIAGTAQLPAGTLPAPFNVWTTTLAMPVVIVDGGADADGNALPDVIGVVSGNPAGRVFKATVSSTPSATSVVVTNSFGIFANDYLLGTRTDGSCAIGLASANPVAPANNIALTANYSLSTGMQNASNIYDLGAAPVLSLFGVNATTQTLDTYDLLQRPLNGTAPGAISIADGIVQIKALYGIHVSGSDPASVDSWVQPTGDWAAAKLTASALAANSAVNQIKAVRVVVVARSDLPERNTEYAGPTAMTLFPDLKAAGLSYSIKTDPQYRYKIYDTTIPVRNSMISKYF